MTQAPMIALLGRIPPDVRAALSDEVSLMDNAAIEALGLQSREGIRHGLTSATGGAAPELLELLPGLKKIVSVGAGTDNFDLVDLQRRGIAFHPTPDVMTEDTAECALSLTLALLRNVVANDRFVRDGDWAKARASLGLRLSGRRVGVVGLGRIGARVAEKITALGGVISYTGRSPKGVPWSFVADIETLAEAVDVLVLTCSGGAETRGLVTARVLERLGPQGFLVNVSRGSVVDEPALIAALEEGRIAGAALDVFENEPTPDPRFAALRSCILSPHAATFTHENRRELIAEIRRLLGLDPSATASG